MKDYIGIEKKMTLSNKNGRQFCLPVRHQCDHYRPGCPRELFICSILKVMHWNPFETDVVVAAVFQAKTTV